MTQTAWLTILIPFAYLMGSVPFGLIVGLAKGVDPRKAGSGNIGATNLGRLLGGKFFAIVFTLDLLKGAIPTLLAGAILRFSAVNRMDCLLWILIGFAAILGHMFSLFLKLKGGKGVATSAGVVIGIFPFLTGPALIGIAVFIAVFLATRYVSLGSIIASISFPISYASLAMIFGWPILGAQLPLLCFAILIPLMIIFKHRANIARLRAGTENRFVKKKPVDTLGPA
jgi:acyl phosphate:glycerol-3-phosphate acyltransferase